MGKHGVSDGESEETVNSVDTLKFRIKRPISKKNNMVRRSGGRGIGPSDKVKRTELAIGKIAQTAALVAGWKHAGEPVIMHLEWDSVSDRVSVELKRVAGYVRNPRKFDLQNVIDIICDSLQQSRVIANDIDIVGLTLKEK